MARIISNLALTPGIRLGVYDIAAPIGEGGMGQVFRARDTKLDRDIAIKVLPEGFVHDADRLARFQREAKTLASLNHPNIAAIYGLEESGGLTGAGDGTRRGRRFLAAHCTRRDSDRRCTADREAGRRPRSKPRTSNGIIHRDLKPARRNGENQNKDPG